MDAVDQYIISLPEPDHEIIAALHDMITDNPGVTARIQYGIPFYYCISWLCYLNPLRTTGVELAFTRAHEMERVGDLLDFNGRKQVAGMVIHALQDIDYDGLRAVIQEALRVDALRSVNPEFYNRKL